MLTNFRIFWRIIIQFFLREANYEQFTQTIIRKNPTDGVLAEVKKTFGQTTGTRHALTIPQQRVFMEHIANHPICYHWWPMFTILLGTGCRIGEALGLRWDDLDYDRASLQADVLHHVRVSDVLLHADRPRRMVSMS